MFDWLKKRDVPVPVPRRPSAASLALDVRPHAGEYQLLHKYLRDRFANRLVLTFGEIEDLLGFSLPAGARVEDTWWSTAVESRSAQSKAWTLAGRTATVNLMAQCVVFERET
jgi:hypothetical protein